MIKGKDIILAAIFCLLLFHKTYAFIGVGDSTNYFYAKARNLFDQKKFDSSLYACNKVIELNNKNEYAYLLRASIRSMTGEYFMATEDFSEAITLSKEKELLESAYYGRGVAKTKLTLYESAIEDFNTNNKLDPTNINVFIYRAYCYIAIKNPEKAIADLNKAEKLSPINSNVEMYKGYAYLLKNNSDSAYFFFEKTTFLDPTNYNSYKSKAEILLNRNELDKAKIEIDKALKLKKDYYDGYDILGAIYRKENNIVEARKIMNVMISIDPKLPKPYFLLAKMDFIQKDYQQALKNFDLSISKGGNYPETYYYRGQLYEILGNYSIAINEYLSAYNLNKDSVICLTNIGHCYEMLNDSIQAEDYYNKAVSAAPKNKDCLNYRGNFLYVMRRFTEAKIDLTNLLVMGSLDYEVYIKLSRIELVFHNYEKSLDYCNKGIFIFELKGKKYFKVELYMQRLITYMFLSRYNLIINEGDLIKKQDHRFDSEIDALKMISYFCLNKQDNFKATINEYSMDDITSNVQLTKLKLFSLIIENNYDSWVDLYYYYCLLNQLDHTTFDLYNSMPFSNSYEIKELIRKDYILSKSIDTNYAIGFDLGFTGDSIKMMPIYEKLIKAIDSKLTEDIQYKEILYLIRAQLNKDLDKKVEALNDFNRAIEINSKFSTAYYLRAEYKKNILKDELGAKEDHSKAQILYKSKGL